MTIAFPHKPGAGGPGSFQRRFEEQANLNNWKIVYGDSSQIPDLIFVIGGTRKIFWLLKMKFKKVPILLRLDGINWLHKKKKVGFKNYIVAEAINFIIKFIHAFIADKIIYQSHFVKEWWSQKQWKNHPDSSIIYNGIDFSKIKFENSSKQFVNRLVVLEGVIDYTPYALQLLNDLAVKLPKGIDIEVYGKFENREILSQIDDRIVYKGYIERSKVFSVLRHSIYLSLDINPACPNTVIEALSCGTPVVAFSTGALPELILKNTGEIVPYGSNPWQLNYPDVKGLIRAILKVSSDYERYSENAIRRAKRVFDINLMFEKYSSEIKTILRP